MNKIFNFTITILLIFITIIFIINPPLIIDSVINTTNIFIKSVFPSLFPFMILSYFLINYNVLYYVSFIINKIFKIDINLISLILLSVLGGFPSNAKYISIYYENGLIDESDKNKLISILYYPSIMFTLGTIGSIYLNDYILGLKILISISLTNFILLFKFKFKKSNTSKMINKSSFANILSTSIKNSIDVLLIILGSMVIFTILINILNEYININNNTLAVLNSILEMSSGIKNISDLYLSTNLKCLLISLSLCFGGVSIHSQILSITDINYKEFLLVRFESLIINMVIVFCLLNM